MIELNKSENHQRCVCVDGSVTVDLNDAAFVAVTAVNVIAAVACDTASARSRLVDGRDRGQH